MQLDQVCHFVHVVDFNHGESASEMFEATPLRRKAVALLRFWGKAHDKALVVQNLFVVLGVVVDGHLGSPLRKVANEEGYVHPEKKRNCRYNLLFKISYLFFFHFLLKLLRKGIEPLAYGL